MIDELSHCPRMKGLSTPFPSQPILMRAIMITHAFQAKRDWRTSPVSLLAKLLLILIGTVCIGFQGASSSVWAAESQDGWERDHWKQQRAEVSYFLKQLFVPKQGLSVVDSMAPSVGFPRYAQGGCQPCHGPQCKAPVTPKAPDLSAPVRVESQKRIQLANNSMSCTLLPDSSWAMTFRESTANRGCLDVLERPPRFS